MALSLARKSPSDGYRLTLSGSKPTSKTRDTAEEGCLAPWSNRNDIDGGGGLEVSRLQAERGKSGRVSRSAANVMGVPSICGYVFCFLSSLFFLGASRYLLLFYHLFF
ncbi:hypothetical protein AWENTII_001590 [Aspergillus wentii]